MPGSVPCFQVFFGLGQASGEGHIVGAKPQETFKVEDSGEPLRLQFAVPGLQFVPRRDVRGCDRKLRGGLRAKLLPESVQRLRGWRAGGTGDRIAREQSDQ